MRCLLFTTLVIVFSASSVMSESGSDDWLSHVHFSMTSLQWGSTGVSDEGKKIFVKNFLKHVH